MRIQLNPQLVNLLIEWVRGVEFLIFEVIDSTRFITLIYWHRFFFNSLRKPAVPVWRATATPLPLHPSRPVTVSRPLRSSLRSPASEEPMGFRPNWPMIHLSRELHPLLQQQVENQWTRSVLWFSRGLVLCCVRTIRWQGDSRDIAVYISVSEATLIDFFSTTRS